MLNTPFILKASLDDLQTDIKFGYRNIRIATSQETVN